MTLARRVAALETALTPTQLVVRWLAEAHSHGSLEAYVHAILDDEPEAYPLNRLCREASAAARAGVRGRVGDQTHAAVRIALRETVFRFELVMRINVVSHAMIDRELLLYTVFMGQLAFLSNNHRKQRQADSASRRGIAQCRALTAQRVDELLAAQGARSIVEERYLDGHQALFPDAVAAWAERLEEAKVLAVMADRLADLDGLPTAASPEPDPVPTRAAVLVADLVEPAKVTALEKLGEAERAMRIATGWLRTKSTDHVP